MSKYCTIEPGDVMWMGTDGVPQNIKPGDTVEIEISGIGVLRNKVVAGNVTAKLAGITFRILQSAARQRARIGVTQGAHTISNAGAHVLRNLPTTTSAARSSTFSCATASR